MNGLTVIENELVPVYETSTGEKVVYGSELHEVLGVKSKFEKRRSGRTAVPLSENDRGK